MKLTRLNNAPGVLDFPTYSPQCCRCRHIRAVTLGEPFTCDAYPDGIPDQVWLAMVKHTAPLEGDHGIRFEEVTPAQARTQMYPDLKG